MFRGLAFPICSILFFPPFNSPVWRRTQQQFIIIETIPKANPSLLFFFLCVCACNSVESVNDGLFHTVELLIQNRSLSLVVDNGAQKSLGKLPRQPSVDHNTQLYIGGTHTHICTNAYCASSSELNVRVQLYVTFACLLLALCGCNSLFVMHEYIENTTSKYTHTQKSPG